MNTLDLNTLNPRQQEAVQAPFDKPLLIVAGAGTGKTRTLTSRLQYLISQGVAPDTICALTFTNKAAREMRSRVELPQARRVSATGEPFIGTFHSLGAAILRREHSFFQRSANFIIYDDHDSFSLLKKLLKNSGSRTSPTKAAQKISWLKNRLTETEDGPRSGDPEITELLRDYEAALWQSNAFDFDDLITKVVRLFREQPDVLRRYQKRAEYVLVDEFQDVNDIQNLLIRQLAAPGRLTVVGDDQQTIYSWRGSNLELFLEFERDWPGTRVVVLDQNYRSTGAILGAASECIAHNQRQKSKKLWTAGPAGQAVAIWESSSEEEEAERVAEALEQNLRPGSGQGMAASGSQAVLYRTNAQSRAIEQALIHRGLSYEVYGGLKFYERREIKDVVAFLRLLANPKDREARDRLEKGLPKFRTRALWPLLEESAPDSRTPREWVEAFLKGTDYFDYVEQALGNPEERRENLAELIYFASTFKELPPLLQQIALLQSTDSLHQRQRPGAVTLTTIHLAKGLEFDKVFVIGCREDVLPHSLSLESAAQVEEERRLLYVAMTRARSELTLSYFDIPSRFLFEIPKTLTEFHGASGETGLNLSEYDEERYITLD